MRHCDIPAGYLRNNDRIRRLPEYRDWKEYTGDRKHKNQFWVRENGRFGHKSLAVEAAQESGELQEGECGAEPMPFQRYMPSLAGQWSPIRPMASGRRVGCATIIPGTRRLLKQKCPDGSAYILCGDRDLVKNCACVPTDQSLKTQILTQSG